MEETRTNPTHIAATLATLNTHAIAGGIRLDRVPTDEATTAALLALEASGQLHITRAGTRTVSLLLA